MFVVPGLREEENVELRWFDKTAKRWFRRHYHDLDKLADYARSLVAEGPANIYFSAGLRHWDGTSDADVTRIVAVMADLDFKCFSGSPQRARAALRSLPLSPSVIVHSGHGYQPWWLLEQPLGVDDWLPAMRGIQAALDKLADHRLDTMSNPSRIMRLPSSQNVKGVSPLPVTIVSANYARRYGLYEFDSNGLWLPESSEEKARRTTERTMVTDWTPPTDLTGEPPVPLSQTARWHWDGQLIVKKPDGIVDRSLSLWSIAKELAKAGATEGQIAGALWERDKSLNWLKYRYPYEALRDARKALNQVKGDHNGGS